MKDQPRIATDGVVKRAQSLLERASLLPGERDAVKLEGHVQALAGYTGSGELDRARAALAAARELEGGERNADEVRRLVEACGHLQGSAAVESARGALRAEAGLGRVTHAGELRGLWEEASRALDSTEGMSAAVARLEAAERLRGEGDARQMRALVRECAPLREGDAALEWALASLLLLAELEGVRDVQAVRVLVTSLEGVWGSDALDRARGVLAAEDEILRWIPSAIVMSLAEKLRAALAGGQGGGTLREKICEMFSEFDADSERYPGPPSHYLQSLPPPQKRFLTASPRPPRTFPFTLRLSCACQAADDFCVLRREWEHHVRRV